MTSCSPNLIQGMAVNEFIRSNFDRCPNCKLRTISAAVFRRPVGRLHVSSWRWHRDWKLGVRGHFMEYFKRCVSNGANRQYQCRGLFPIRKFHGAASKLVCRLCRRGRLFGVTIHLLRRFIRMRVWRLFGCRSITAHLMLGYEGIFEFHYHYTTSRVSRYGGPSIHKWRLYRNCVSRRLLDEAGEMQKAQKAVES